jgi:hypothetical protein
MPRLLRGYHCPWVNVPVPQGLKVFVNVAWSKDVRPPIDGVAKAVEFATVTQYPSLPPTNHDPFLPSTIVPLAIRSLEWHQNTTLSFIELHLSCFEHSDVVVSTVIE